MSDWEILKKLVKLEIWVANISNIMLEGEKENDLIGKILTNHLPERVYGIFLKKLYS